jgi:hypothetical protein
MPVSRDAPDSDAEYRCATAARWLPRALAGSVLAATVLAAFRFDPYEVLSVTRFLRAGLSLLGAILALWVVKKGAEVRTVFVLAGEEMVVRHGSRSYGLRLEEIERLDFEPPFAVTRTWLPALIVHDRFGQPWRVSALIENGSRFVEDLLRRVGRSDLETWAATLHLESKMARAGLRVAVGYATAAIILAAGIAYYLH